MMHEKLDRTKAVELAPPRWVVEREHARMALEEARAELLTPALAQSHAAIAQASATLALVELTSELVRELNRLRTDR